MVQTKDVCQFCLLYRLSYVYFISALILNTFVSHLLVTKYTNGLYTFGKHDIPFLVSLTMDLNESKPQDLDSQNSESEFSTTFSTDNCNKDEQPRRKYQKNIFLTPSKPSK